MDIQSILIMVVAVVALTVVLSIVSIKKQKSCWIGVLEKKIIKEDNSSANIYFTLRFRTDDGKKVNVQVSQDMFNAFNKGDRVIKKSGVPYPEKA